MKAKQLILVVVLAAVLGGLGWMVTQKQRQSYQTTGTGQGGKVLPGFPLNDVARVVIREGTNQVALVKDQDTWKVRERANYPANFEEIGGFLRKVWELKAVQSEQVGPSMLGRFALVTEGAGTNVAVRVDFEDAVGKSVATLYLGKKHMRKGGGAPGMGMGGDEGFPDGRYVMTPAKVGEVALVSEVFGEVEPKADRWLQKDTFKVEKLKSIEVTHRATTNSWSLSREAEGGELKLADAQGEEKLDTSKASSAGYALGYPSFTDVMPGDAKTEETGLGEAVTAKIQTFDGFTYTVQVAKKPGAGAEENYCMKVAVAAELPTERVAGADEKPEDKERLDKEFKEKQQKLQDKLKTEKSSEPWIYVVSKYTVDPILKERRELMQEKKDETKPAADAGGMPGMPGILSAPDAAGAEEGEETDEAK